MSIFNHTSVELYLSQRHPSNAGTTIVAFKIKCPLGQKLQNSTSFLIPYNIYYCAFLQKYIKQLATQPIPINQRTPISHTYCRIIPST